MEINLEKVDLIRERTGLGYNEARQVLENANGDVINALVSLECGEADGDQMSPGGLATGIASPVRKLFRQGNMTKIRVSNGNGPLLEMPVTIGLAGALLAPKIAALGLTAMLMSRYSLEIEPPPEEGPIN